MKCSICHRRSTNAGVIKGLRRLEAKWEFRIIKEDVKKVCERCIVERAIFQLAEVTQDILRTTNGYEFD